ncbi:hypothetical protein GQF03_10695 [Sneathiella chungangensis]|uniref:Zn-ribbon domain-containing OB-fold protein n=1 Tax=Sneathiella chungangensis TaxID=1418234 RepID=A0A845MFQ3_9PROT|nr:Zn-ribbon domain-containing OB-fold protein [Sneathiella chungangensis]MZR22798.1 hypothetical protein [Sneathiella chungangensis]
MEYNKPIPVVDSDSEPFWASGLSGKLKLPHCSSCGKFHYYPRTLCPHCHLTDLSYKEVSGNGTIYSYTVQRRPAGNEFKDDVPYIVALIDLEEGPRMLSNIVGLAPEEVAIGQRVAVQFITVSDSISLPVFQVQK